VGRDTTLSLQFSQILRYIFFILQHMEILVLSFSFPSSIVVLDDLVQEEMLIAKDEIFGPVMALAKFK
jgi:hypothetical protein